MKEITKIVKNDSSLIPVITGLSALNFTQADIGIMLGYAGKNPKSWFQRLKSKCPSIEAAYQAGKDMADTALVVSATRAAMGYEYEEVTTTTKTDADGKKETTIRRIPKIKHPDVAMLKFLLVNRLPEFFQEKKNISVGNSRYLEGNEKEAIANFAAKLVKATTVDTKFEETDSDKVE